MAQVLVREPGTPHLCTQSLSYANTARVAAGDTEARFQEVRAWRRSSQPGQDIVVLTKVPLYTPTFRTQTQLAQPGVLKSKGAGRETARVATPDAWEPSRCRLVPWQAGLGPGEQVRLPQLKSLCVFLLSLGFQRPVSLGGGGGRLLV